MIKINLLPVVAKGKKVGRIPLIIIIAAIVTAVVLVPFYLYSTITLKSLESKKATLEQQIKEYEPKVKTMVAQLELLKRKGQAIDELAGIQRLYWSKKLNELSDLIPQNVKIDRIYLTANQTGSRTLNIEGYTACRTGEERIKLIGDFITALENKQLSSFYYKEDQTPNFGEIEFISASADKKDGYLLAKFNLKMSII